MDMNTLASIQDALNAELTAVVTKFKEDNPTVTITNLNYEAWAAEPCFHSSVNMTAEGATVSRTTTFKTQS
tara:strand:+ start:46833 stop:47045 length:213 start_codon:yes stop_codon:yes gene_type:complete